MKICHSSKSFWILTIFLILIYVPKFPLIPPSPKISQGAKFPNTTKLYTTYMCSLSKIFYVELLKDIKIFFIKGLYCHIGSPILSILYCPIPGPTVDKTHHRAVISSFSVQLLHFFSYAGGILNLPFLLLLMIYSGYAANYNTQGTFVIIFWICSDLLNCLSSVSTIVITTESG